MPTMATMAMAMQQQQQQQKHKEKQQQQQQQQAEAEQSCFMSPLPLEHCKPPPRSRPPTPSAQFHDPDSDIALLLAAPDGIRHEPPPPTLLPRRELFLIWIIHASQGFQTTMLFPMLVFMVDRYGVAPKGSVSTGKYAGLLASLFPLAQFCTSILWGTISDRTGRKPLLALGNTVSAASAFFLGLCNTFPAACTVRFVGGLLNGTMTVTKSVVGELCDGTNKAKGFGILNLAWGVGSVAGPVVSGLLAQPCTQYGWQHCPRTLQQYPFLLPCLAATCLSLVALCASLAITETHPRCRAKYEPISLETASDLSTDACEVASMEEDLEYEAPPLKAVDAGDIECNHHRPCSPRNLENNRPGTPPGPFKLIIRSRPGREMELELVPPTAMNIVPEEATMMHAGDSSNFEAAAAAAAKLARSGGSSSNGMRHFRRIVASKLRLPATITPLLRDRDVLLSSFCYSMTGLIFIITDELFPIFGAASASIGGLGFNSSSLGIILGVGGVVLFLYTLCLYPTVARRVGPLRGFRYGILCSAPLWILFPATSLLPTMPRLQWAFLILAMAARSVIACTCFTGVLILVSNSASPANMGAVTGLSHSFCSFFRAIGPACGGILWSFASQQTFRFHQFVAWQFVTLLTLLTYALSFLLSPSLTQAKGEAPAASMTRFSSKP